MIFTDTQKLKEAGIDSKYWDECYITPDGTIFTPVIDESGNVLKSGTAAYNEWIESSNIPDVPMPTLQEQMAKMLLTQAKQESKINDINKTNAQLMLKVAELEGEKKNV